MSPLSENVSLRTKLDLLIGIRPTIGSITDVLKT